MKPIAATFAAGVLLLAGTPLLAQTNPPSMSTTPGSSPGSSQGLPPATMQDQTGRSPGQLPDQATTPNAPSVIPPANPSASELNSGGTLNREPGSVGRSGG